MKIKRLKKKRIAIIEPEGDLYAPQMEELDKCVSAVMRENYSRLVLNMEKVNHIDYRCLNTLTELSEKIRGIKGELLLIGANNYVLNILRVVGLDQFLQINASSFKGRARHLEGCE